VPIRGRGGAGVEAENLAEVNLTHLFAADVILPVQIIHPPADRWLRRLCLAILEDALKYLEGYGGYGGRRARARQRHEAWEWFLSDAEYCFSFTIVCSVLNLNAEAVRGAVRRRLAQDGAALSDVSRGLRQPLSRVSSARSARRTGARSSLKKTRDLQGIEGDYFLVRGKRKASRRK
jgi:hypothetical protein